MAGKDKSGIFLIAVIQRLTTKAAEITNTNAKTP